MSSFTTQRYSTAIASSNLRVRADTEGDADLLLASGLAGSGSDLAALILRARTERDCHSHLRDAGPAVRSARDALRRHALHRNDHAGSASLARQQVEQVADAVLVTLLYPACPQCQGRGFTLLPAAPRPTLGDVACGTCGGSGKRRLMAEGDEQQRLAEQLDAELAGKLETLDRRMRGLLRE